MSKLKWYILKGKDGLCQIVSVKNEQAPEAEGFWGPFSSQGEAIARRVGLIRAGKCQPFWGNSEFRINWFSYREKSREVPTEPLYLPDFKRQLTSPWQN